MQEQTHKWFAAVREGTQAILESYHNPRKNAAEWPFLQIAKEVAGVDTATGTQGQEDNVVEGAVAWAGE